eukprot:s4524_g4.t1
MRLHSAAVSGVRQFRETDRRSARPDVFTSRSSSSSSGGKKRSNDSDPRHKHWRLVACCCEIPDLQR